MIDGTIYGVVLNDRHEIDALGSRLTEKPYGAPPSSPVVYIKPGGTLNRSGVVIVPRGVTELIASTTIGLLFGRPFLGGDPMACVTAAFLAIDVSEPEADYYRPAIRQRCRDGFLPLTELFAIDPIRIEAAELLLEIEGQIAHRWSLDRLVRPAATLVRELAAFMPFAIGDALLCGLPGDAPRVAPGQQVVAHGTGFPALSVRIIEEAAA